MSGHSPFDHVKDSTVFELPVFFDGLLGQHIFHLPKINILGYDLQLTKFMVLQSVAGILSLLIFTGLARHIRNGRPARGAWWNFWETLALFIRDEVVRPAIGVPHEHHHDDHGHGDDHHGHGHADHHAPATPTGHAAAVEVAHPADRYLPFIWTAFFYILFCNLLGAVPFLGSPTADTGITAALALIALGHTIYYGSCRSGVVGFWTSLVPNMDMPLPLKIAVCALLWPIELIGLFIKHGVLAVRLFANLLAGHTVIAVFLGFIALAADVGSAWYIVTPASIFAQVAIGLLELFVAFLQAYVFSLLASVFIGAAVNPH